MSRETSGQEEPPGKGEEIMTVHLVGAGCGTPSWLTLRGAELLRTAEAVVYDRLIHPDLLQLCPKGCEYHPVGKRESDHTLPQKEINALLVELGKRLAILAVGIDDDELGSLGGIPRLGKHALDDGRHRIGLARPRIAQYGKMEAKEFIDIDEDLLVRKYDGTTDRQGPGPRHVRSITGRDHSLRHGQHDRQIRR